MPFCSSFVFIKEVSMFSFFNEERINSLNPSLPTFVKYVTFPPRRASVTAVVTVSPPKNLFNVEVSANEPFADNSMRHSPITAISIFCSIQKNP